MPFLNKGHFSELLFKIIDIQNIEQLFDMVGVVGSNPIAPTK